ncbi:MAG: hypothetical protein ACON30_04950 [Flavobacteriaceae bacterium]
MNFGGAFLSSKNNYLKDIPQNWVPKTLYVPTNQHMTKTLEKLITKGIMFPLIVKPDMGERGKNVALLATAKELEQYLIKIQQPVLIQEYISYPIELGILFYWDTNDKPCISSIGVKKLCEIEGNGKDTLKKLVSKNHRIANRKEFLQEKFKTQWHQIVPEKEKILIEPIGNHNLGTAFYDGKEHYSEEMLEWVASCVKNIPGFDYGRLDLKIENWNAFKNNNGIKILEINGVNSEPIHIYDPSYSLWKAYKDIFHHMNIIYKLSKHKTDKKTPPVSLFDFIRGAKKVINNKKITQLLYT